MRTPVERDKYLNDLLQRLHWLLACTRLKPRARAIVLDAYRELHDIRDRNCGLPFVDLGPQE